MHTKLDDYQQQVNVLLSSEKGMIYVSSIADAEASLQRLKELRLDLQNIQKQIELDAAELQKKTKQSSLIPISDSLRVTQAYPVLSEDCYMLQAHNTLKDKINLSLRQISKHERDLAKLIHFPRYIARLSLVFGGTGQIVLGQRKKGITIIVISILGLIALIIPGIIVITLGVIDAYQIAKRVESGKTISDWEFFWTKKAKSDWKVQDVVFVDIVEEPCGIQTINLDNSRSEAKVLRRHVVTAEWSQTYAIEHEKIHSETISLEPNITKSSVINRTIENFVRQKHSYTKGKIDRLEETIELVSLPNTSTCVEIRWKNIIENWEIVLVDQYEQTLYVPFRFFVRKSFDHVTIDNPVCNNNTIMVAASHP